VPEMLREQLRDSGVKKRRIDVVPGEVEAINAALGMAREGDLVMIFGDNIERCWSQVAGHRVEEGNSVDAVPEKSAQSFVEEDPEAFTLDPGSELIRDERGVRIARVDEESD
jgi:cyanophycin synthetase